MSMMRLLNDRYTAGFAIPAAIFVIVVVSILALSGLYLAQNNLSANMGMRRSWKALNAADAGAKLVQATWDTTYPSLSPGDSLDTGWRTLPDSSVFRTVVLRVDDGSGTGLAALRRAYRLRTTGRPRASATAQRSIITALKAADPTSFCCDGAVKGGGSGNQAQLKSGSTLSGLDTIPAAWGGLCSNPLDDRPGIAWKDSARVMTEPGTILQGDPPIVVDSTMDAQNMFEFGGYDYDDLVSVADITLSSPDFYGAGPVLSGGSCDTSVESNWGAPLDSSHPCFDHFPIIHAPGFLTIKGPVIGQGILLVDKALTIDDDFEFYGIVIVKGPLQMKGYSEIYGGVIVGGELTMESGDVSRYSQCAVSRAFQAILGTSFAGAQPLAGRHWFEVIN